MRKGNYNMKKLLYCSTPIGRIGIQEQESHITDLFFDSELPVNLPPMEETPLLLHAKEQLLEYFNGNRTTFTIPLAPQGTEFQKSVWTALQNIPYGETRSYKEIATIIGNPKASRAVGMANNKNPIAIFIPCHRVIGSNGAMVGYAGGLPIKEYLLNIENTAPSLK